MNLDKHSRLVKLAHALRSKSAVIAAITLTLCASAVAQSTEHLTLISGYTAGGPFDVLARRVAQEFAKQTGRATIVENRPGAGALIAAEAVLRSKPSANQLYITVSPSLTITPQLMRSKTFNPKELTPIALLSEYPNVLIVRSDSPFRSLADIIAKGKLDPRPSYGSGGIGTSNHMATELLQAATGTKFLHVPYKGSGPALQDLLGGQVDFMFIDSSAVAPMLSAGRVRALAVTSEKRLQGELADVSTMKEAGVPQATFSVWVGVFGPPKMPKDIVETLEHNFISVMNNPDLAAATAAGGHNVLALGRKELASRVDHDYAMWGRVIRDAKIEATQ